MRQKNGGKVKNIRYIEVEGVKNEYLDAALLFTCGHDVLNTYLQSEGKLIKKAGITIQNLKQDVLEYNDIIHAVSPHMLESYTFYNVLANSFERKLLALVESHFGDEYQDFDKEMWDSSLRKLLLEDEIYLPIAINILRFYKNGEFKELIQTLLSEEEYALKYYDELGIKIEGFDLDWDERLRQKYEGMLGLEDFEVPTESITENGLNASSKLKIVLKMLNDVATEVEGLGDHKELEGLLYSEQERVKALTQQIDQLKRDVKSKDTQSKVLNKENRALVKQLETANQKIEQHQKEIGRLGQALGESRKEQESLEKTNTHLERRVTMFDAEKKSITSTMKRDYEKASLKAIEREESLKKQLSEQESLLGLEKDKNAQLNEELVGLKADFEQANAILEATELERNELINQLNEVSTGNPVQSNTNDSKDELFDFDVNEIDDFINFDNKPTRN